MIRFSPMAARDLERLIEWLVENSPVAASRLHGEIQTVLDSLDHGEYEGPEYVLLRSGRRVRSWPVPPVRVYYQRRGDVLFVVRIYHQARRPIARLG